MPRAAEADGGQPLGEVEAVVVERRDDDPFRRAVAPQSVCGEKLRRGARLRSGGPAVRSVRFGGLRRFVPDGGEQLAQTEEPQRRGGEQAGDPVFGRHAVPFEQRQRLAVGCFVRNPPRGEEQPVRRAVTVV